MASTLDTYRALLKTRYVDENQIEKLVYPENTLLARLEKRGDTGMVGYDLKVPVFYGNPQGWGASFSTAQTNASNTRSDAWTITAGDYFGVVHIGDKVFKASRTNKGAELQNKVVEMDQLYVQGGDNLSAYLWGNGGGAIGRRASASGNVITLTQPEQSANFERDMYLVASPDDGSDATHALRAGTSTAVNAVNRANGQVTLANAANITAFADGDYLFRESDFFGTTGNVVLKGVQSFVPATDTLGTLWGVTSATRQSDPQRWGGCRVDPSAVAGKTIEERIKILFAQMTGRFKAKAPTEGYLHPEDFQVLETLLSARGQRALDKSSAQFGFPKIEIATASGIVPIYTDRHCPKGTFFAFRMENWWISSMGELLHPQTGDGLEILRRATTTDYEFRLISYPLLACNAPKNSGRVPLYT